MAEDWAVRMVSDDLERASDVNETRTREQLKALGIGAGDLDAALAELMEQGKVEEEAPDQFRHISDELRGGAAATAAEEEPAAEAAVASEEEEGAESGPPAKPDDLAERLAVVLAQDSPGVIEAPTEDRVLILSRPMIQAMDPVQLGAVLLAAVNAEAQRTILLRIEQ